MVTNIRYAARSAIEARFPVFGYQEPPIASYDKL